MKKVYIVSVYADPFKSGELVVDSIWTTQKQAFKREDELITRGDGPATTSNGYPVNRVKKEWK